MPSRTFLSSSFATVGFGQVLHLKSATVSTTTLIHPVSTMIAKDGVGANTLATDPTWVLSRRKGWVSVY